MILYYICIHCSKCQTSIINELITEVSMINAFEIIKI